MRKRLLSIGLLLALVLALLPTAALADDTAADAPVVGGVYYFDLTSIDLSGIEISDKVNENLPDPTLHYVPFAFAGAVNAYVLTAASSGDTSASTKASENSDETVGSCYEHALFAAVDNIAHNVSWATLHENGLVFGGDYTSGGVSYTHRLPSVGSNSTAFGSVVPAANEWDKIQNYIKNSDSWGQDTSVRGGNDRIFRTPGVTSTSQYNASRPQYRPVLELKDELDDLRVVTLALNGGTLGEASSIQIIVKAGEAFAAPGKDGLSAPEDADETFFWKDEDGAEYQPGDDVPETAAALTAVWKAEPEEPEEPEKPQRPLLLPVISGSLQFASGDNNPFKDVRAIDWFYDEVLYAYRNGLVSGTAHDTFSPGETFTRGMLLTILARADGVRTSGTPWYQAGCDWAARNGISDGENPGEAITREEFAQILYRCAQYRGSHMLWENEISQFSDAEDVSDGALHAVRWAVAETILRGDEYKLNPQGFTTRAEAAAMLYRFFN